MSFICKVCGPVENCQKQIKVPIKVREVEYNLQVKTIYEDGESLKIVRKTQGTEIVEEASYCKNHIPTITEPQKVAKITRNQLIKTVIIRKNNEEDNEIEEENTKRTPRNKDKKE